VYKAISGKKEGTGKLPVQNSHYTKCIVKNRLNYHKRPSGHAVISKNTGHTLR